jgi:hypothetical protein
MLPGHHMQTGNWGSSNAAKQFRNAQKALTDAGQIDDAFLMGVDDVQGLFGDMYDSAILDAIDALP